MERFTKKLNVQQIATALTELDLRLPDDHGDKIAGDVLLFQKILKLLLDKLGSMSDVETLVLPTIIKRDGFLCSLLDKSLSLIFDRDMKFEVVKCALSPECAKKDVTSQVESIVKKFSKKPPSFEFTAKEYEPRKIKVLESKFSTRISIKKGEIKQTTPTTSRASQRRVPKSKSIKSKPVDLKQVIFTFDNNVLKPFPAHQRNFCDAYSYWNLGTVSYTGKNTVIAIIDSGVNADEFKHEKFQDKSCVDFTGSTFIDKSGHGTLCATIAASSTEGVARDAKLIILKVTDDVTHNAAALTVVQAMKHLVQLHDNGHRIDVVSLSMGSNKFVPELCSEIMQLLYRRMIVVCAASNNGHQFRQSVCFPANIGSVLCIGSHDCHGKASSFSPVGQPLDFLAPGENIESSQGLAKSGTSFAAPAVAGLICLVLESIRDCCGNNLTLAKRFHNHWMIKEILKEMSTNPGVHIDDRGYGALDPTRYFRNPAQTLEHILES